MNKRLVRFFWRVISIFEKISFASGDAGILLASALVLTLVLMVFSESIIRYGNIGQAIYADELSGYMMVAILFLSVAYTFKEDRHIKVVIVFNRFPQKVRSVLGQLQPFVFFVWVSLIIPPIFDLCKESFEMGSHSITSLRVSLWIPQFFFLVGVILLWLVALARILSNIRQMATKNHLGQASNT